MLVWNFQRTTNRNDKFCISLFHHFRIDKNKTQNKNQKNENEKNNKPTHTQSRLAVLRSRFLVLQTSSKSTQIAQHRYRRVMPFSGLFPNRGVCVCIIIQLLYIIHIINVCTKSYNFIAIFLPPLRSIRRCSVLLPLRFAQFAISFMHNIHV